MELCQVAHTRPLLLCPRKVFCHFVVPILASHHDKLLSLSCLAKNMSHNINQFWENTRTGRVEAFRCFNSTIGFHGNGAKLFSTVLEFPLSKFAWYVLTVFINPLLFRNTIFRFCMLTQAIGLKWTLCLWMGLLSFFISFNTGNVKETICLIFQKFNKNMPIRTIHVNWLNFDGVTFPFRMCIFALSTNKNRIYVKRHLWI